jgi:ABC-type glycerol-3-phosphate transport system substrate-binding protein
MKTWNEFFQLLEKNNLFSKNVDFTFKGDFGHITEFGPTYEIAGFYSGPKNFYFNLFGTKQNAQVQITSSQKNDEYTSHKLFLKMIFSDINIS